LTGLTNDWGLLVEVMAIYSVDKAIGKRHRARPLSWHHADPL
jgi:hypothetical protein